MAESTEPETCTSNQQGQCHDSSLTKEPHQHDDAQGQEDLSSLMRDLIDVDTEIRNKDTGSSSSGDSNKLLSYFDVHDSTLMPDLVQMKMITLKFNRTGRKKGATYGHVGLTFAVDFNGILAVFGPDGELLVKSYSTGHKRPIIDIAVSASENPVVAFLSEDGHVTVHRVVLWWQGKRGAGKMLKNEKALFRHQTRPKSVSRREWPTFGAELVPDGDYRLPAPAPAAAEGEGADGSGPPAAAARPLALDVMTHPKHKSVVTVSDSAGNLNFLWGGTLNAQSKAMAVAPGLALPALARAGQSLVAADRNGTVHFVHATKWSFIKNKCHVPGAAYTQVAYDPIRPFHLYAGTETGDLLMFDTAQEGGRNKGKKKTKKSKAKQKMTSCTLLASQPAAGLQGQAVAALAPTPGYIAVASAGHMAVYNTSLPGGFHPVPVGSLAFSHLTKEDHNNEENTQFVLSSIRNGAPAKGEKVAVSMADLSSGNIYFLNQSLPFRPDKLGGGMFDNFSLRDYIVFLPLLFLGLNALKGSGGSSGGTGLRVFGSKRRRGGGRRASGKSRAAAGGGARDRKPPSGTTG
mmetsp:Transcript_12479/g.22245  ORF Transcript_12479/g.22245 Transcript_12479/m.22245 type:complete len:575 (+) Transcript_12479:36-1760(+)